MQGRDSEAHSADAAEQRKKQALKDDRLHHLPARGSKRLSYGELPLPLHGAHQLQMSHVDASDQQDEGYRSPEEQERGARVRRERLLQRLQR